MKKYHSQIGFPPAYTPPSGVYPTIPTHHARDMAEKRDIDLPTEIDFSKFYVFEITVINDVVSKFAIRGEYNDEKDICMAGLIDAKWKNKNDPKFVIFSVWLNDFWDEHRSLDDKVYSRP